jgi:hypothetical protein
MYHASAMVGPHIHLLVPMMRIVHYSLVLAWTIVMFVVEHPQRNTLFWVVTDVFEACTFRRPAQGGRSYWS